MSTHPWKHINIELSNIEKEIPSKVEPFKGATDNKVCSHWYVKEFIVCKPNAGEILAWQVVQSSTERRVSTIQNQQFGIVVEVDVLNVGQIVECI